MKNKRLLSLLLCICLAVSCLAGITVSASADDTIKYTVKKGDYLYQVCKRNGLDYYTCKNAIMILNGWSTETQCNRIVPGQDVYLPASNDVAKTVKASATTTTSSTSTLTINGKSYSTTTTSTSNVATKNGDTVAYYLVPYTVKAGDYLAKICSDLNTSYTAYKNIINSVNGLTGTRIYAGKPLYIPTATPPAGSSCYAVIAHRVDTGETMTTICNGLGGQPASSAITTGVNYGTNINYITSGQVVYVPVATTAASSGENGSGNTSGSSVGSGYNINLLYTSNYGIPTATVNGISVQKSLAGNIVKINGKAKTGYALSAIKVTRKDTNANVVLDDNNSFTMPPCDIDVEVQYSNAHHINKVTSGEGKFKTTVSNEEVEYALYGDIVTVVPEAKQGYAATSVKYNSKEIIQSDDGSFSFTMPNSDVTVSVEFRKVSESDMKPIHLTKSLTTSSGNINEAGTVSFTVDGTKNTKAYKGSQVVINIDIRDNYKMTGLAVYKSSTYSDTNKVELSPVGNNKYAFKMLDQDMYVDISFGYTVTYSIAQNSSKASKTGGSISFFVKDSSGTLNQISKACKGTEVYLVPDPSSGYKLSSIDAVTANGKSHVRIYNADSSHPYQYIIMPESNVTINPTWETGGINRYKIINSCKANGAMAFYVDSAKGGLEIAPATIPAGTKVYVRTTPNSGYKTDKVLTSPNTVLNPETDGYSFTMPNNDIEVAAYFTNESVQCVYFTKSVTFYYDNTYSKDITSSLVLDPQVYMKVLAQNTEVDNAILGETVRVKITAPTGYNIGRVYANSTLLHGNVDAASFNFDYTLRDIDKGGVTFKVELYANAKYSIMYSSKNGAYFISVNGVPKSSDVSDVCVHQKVSIYITGNIDTYKIFTGNSNYGKDVVLTRDTAFVKEFTMPDENVGTMFTFK